MTIKLKWALLGVGLSLSVSFIFPVSSFGRFSRLYPPPPRSYTLVTPVALNWIFQALQWKELWADYRSDLEQYMKDLKDPQKTPQDLADQYVKLLKTLETKGLPDVSILLVSAIEYRDAVQGAEIGRVVKTAQKLAGDYYNAVLGTPLAGEAKKLKVAWDSVKAPRDQESLDRSVRPAYESLYQKFNAVELSQRSSRRVPMSPKVVKEVRLPQTIEKVETYNQSLEQSSVECGEQKDSQDCAPSRGGDAQEGCDRIAIDEQSRLKKLVRTLPLKIATIIQYEACQEIPQDSSIYIEILRDLERRLVPPNELWRFQQPLDRASSVIMPAESIHHLKKLIRIMADREDMDSDKHYFMTLTGNLKLEAEINLILKSQDPKSDHCKTLLKCEVESLMKEAPSGGVQGQVGAPEKEQESSIERGIKKLLAAPTQKLIEQIHNTEPAIWIKRAESTVKSFKDFDGHGEAVIEKSLSHALDLNLDLLGLKKDGISPLTFHRNLIDAFQIAKGPLKYVSDRLRTALEEEKKKRIQPELDWKELQTEKIKLTAEANALEESKKAEVNGIYKGRVFGSLSQDDQLKLQKLERRYEENKVEGAHQLDQLEQKLKENKNTRHQAQAEIDVFNEKEVLWRDAYDEGRLHTIEIGFRNQLIQKITSIQKGSKSKMSELMIRTLMEHEVLYSSIIANRYQFWNTGNYLKNIGNMVLIPLGKKIYGVSREAVKKGLPYGGALVGILDQTLGKTQPPWNLKDDVFNFVFNGDLKSSNKEKSFIDLKGWENIVNPAHSMTQEQLRDHLKAVANHYIQFDSEMRAREKWIQMELAQLEKECRPGGAQSVAQTCKRKFDFLKSDHWGYPLDPQHPQLITREMVEAKYMELLE